MASPLERAGPTSEEQMVTPSPGAAGEAGVIVDAASRRTLAAAFVAAVLSVMPTFLLGGVAVLVREDLNFSESRLGLCITAYYVVSAISAVPGGHLAERLGGLRGCSVGIVLSATTLASVAAFAHSWWQLAVCLMAGGLANALLQPATNLALARGIPADRQGLAFGLKMANGPVATMLAGLSASVIATTVGWRWAFIAMACLAMVFFVVRPA
ncbi:MAG TPA: MFS transporter, partial [Euzebyales bacterium]|nr:MFS transporter [Euzebyales bacterium]